MYKAKNGLIIADSSTGQVWDIETAQDLKNALLMYPLFQTVHDHALWAALDSAIKDRRECDNMRDLAQFIADGYR